MFQWLFDLPAVWVMVISALVPPVLIFLTGLVANRLPSDEKRATAALDAYKIIVTFTAILLSFSLVQANGLFRSTEDAASSEAGALNQLHRCLVRMHTPAASAAVPLLLSYMQAVVQEDWPAMRRGQNIGGGQQKIAALNRAVQTMGDPGVGKAQLYGDILKQLDAVNDARQRRMDAVDSGLPVVLWQATGMLCFVLLLLSAAIRMPSRFMALAGHAVAIGVLTSLTFVVDQPYKGEYSVGPGAIERVIVQALARVD